jgi:hypothetical protein
MAMSNERDEEELVEPVAPAFPKTVLIAGIVWILFGGWILLIATLVYSVERRRPASP